LVFAYQLIHVKVQEDLIGMAARLANDNPYRDKVNSIIVIDPYRLIDSIIAIINNFLGKPTKFRKFIISLGIIIIMASETDFSLLTDAIDSIEVSSTQQGSQKERKLTSPIHEYARPPKDDEPTKDAKGRKILYCIRCSHPASSTTNLQYHVKAKHHIDVKLNDGRTKGPASEKLKQLYAEALAQDDTTEVDSCVLKSVLNEDVIEQAVLNLIVVHNLPFRAVQWPELHVLCQALNPESKSHIPASHTTVAKMIDNTFQSQIDIVRKKLQSALTNIHLAVDIWTSPNNYLLLAICAHFIDDQEERIKALLALRTVAGHSGDDQWDVVLPVLKDFGIVRKLGALIADNSSTNDTLCTAISQYLLEDEGIEWDPTQLRIRCQGHIINLAVQSFLFKDVIDIKQIESYEEDEESGRELSDRQKKEKQDTFRRMGVLGKLHNIVVHIRSSAARTKLFVSYAGRRIPLDNRTRWNSWYHMLTVALKHRVAVDKYVEENLSMLQKDCLNPQDWQLLRIISDFLAPFEKATLKLQGDDATLDKVLPTMDILIEHMDRALVRLSLFLACKN